MSYYNNFHTSSEFEKQACSIHGKAYWTLDTGCRECARLFLEDNKQETHNGAGCYDSDSDFA